MATDTVFKNKIVTARKEYDCVACEYINNGDDPEEWMEEEELKIWNEAKSKGFKINKGDKHIFQSGVYDGEMYTYRAIVEIHGICIDNDVFCD